MALRCVSAMPHPSISGWGGISSVIKFIGHFCHRSLAFQGYLYTTALPDRGVPCSDFSPVVSNEKRYASLLRLPGF